MIQKASIPLHHDLPDPSLKRRPVKFLHSKYPGRNPLQPVFSPVYIRTGRPRLFLGSADPVAVNPLSYPLAFSRESAPADSTFYLFRKRIDENRIRPLSQNILNLSEGFSVNDRLMAL